MWKLLLYNIWTVWGGVILHLVVKGYLYKEGIALRILRHGYAHISTTIVWDHSFEKYLAQKIISSCHRKYKLPKYNN